MVVEILELVKRLDIQLKHISMLLLAGFGFVTILNIVLLLIILLRGI